MMSSKSYVTSRPEPCRSDTALYAFEKLRMNLKNMVEFFVFENLHNIEILIEALDAFAN